MSIQNQRPCLSKRHIFENRAGAVILVVILVITIFRVEELTRKIVLIEKLRIVVQAFNVGRNST